METDYKKIYRNILKLTHPDNCDRYTSSLPLGVKKYLDKIRNDATEAYEEGDIERLVDIQVELLGEKSSCENVQKDFDKPYENEYYEESTTSEEEDNSTFSLVSFLNYLSLKLLIKEIKAEFYGS